MTKPAAIRKGWRESDARIAYWPTWQSTLHAVVPRSPEGWLFFIHTNGSVRLTAETLAGAELFAKARGDSPALPIYYGPGETP